MSFFCAFILAVRQLQNEGILELASLFSASLCSRLNVTTKNMHLPCSFDMLLPLSSRLIRFCSFDAMPGICMGQMNFVWNVCSAWSIAWHDTTWRTFRRSAFSRDKKKSMYQLWFCGRAKVSRIRVDLKNVDCGRNCILRDFVRGGAASVLVLLHLDRMFHGNLWARISSSFLTPYICVTSGVPNILLFWMVLYYCHCW